MQSSAAGPFLPRIRLHTWARLHAIEKAGEALIADHGTLMLQGWNNTVAAGP